MKNYFLLLCFFSISLFGQHILPLLERAALFDEIQKERIEKLLPDLMQEQNLDMWVLITREYNEDPVVKTLLPPTWLNARRRTILVFSKTGCFCRNLGGKMDRNSNTTRNDTFQSISRNYT